MPHTSRYHSRVAGTIASSSSNVLLRGSSSNVLLRGNVVKTVLDALDTIFHRPQPPLDLGQTNHSLVKAVQDEADAMLDSVVVHIVIGVGRSATTTA